VTWLHEKRAREGIRLTREGDERVWTVLEVYRGIPMPESWVKDRRKAHERWRKHTDV
jgi:hypothetical protein